MKQVLCILLGLLIAEAGIRAQELTDLDIIERYLLETETEREELEDALELIDLYSLTKIALLNADAEMISVLPTITRADAREIKNYLKDNPSAGLDKMCKDLNLSEIQTIILKNCSELSFGIVETKDKKDFVKFLTYSDLPLQENKGIKTNKFQGSNFGIKHTLNLSVSGFEMGFSTDKDMGETDYADHYAGWIKKSFGQHEIILGNFKVNQGLGLAMGNTFCNSKYASILYSNQEVENEILPNLSAYNSKTLRGGAYSGSWLITKEAVIAFTAYGANTERSATINKNGNIQSLYTSNLFRTESEINKKNNITENTFGGSVGLKLRSMNLLYSIFSISYDKNVESESAYMINDKNAIFQSLALQYNLKKMSINSEIAFAEKGIASQAIVKYKLNKSTINGAFRYFGDDYKAPYGSNTFENTYPNNEVGFSLGFNRELTNNFNFELVTDYYETLKSTSTILFPVKGMEIETRTFWNIDDNNELLFRLKYENKDASNSDTRDKNSNYKFRSDYYCKIGNFKHHLRADFNFLAESNVRAKTKGGMLYYELSYKPTGLFDFLIAGAYFDTDDYASACYAINTFSGSSLQIRSLYYNGFFGKFNVGVHIDKCLVAVVQYVAVYKPDEKTLGSGLTEIDGNLDHRFRISFQYLVK